MFGLFLLRDRRVRLRPVRIARCRVCGEATPGTLFRVERVFQFFFLTLFRWRSQYGVLCERCQNFFDISPETGERMAARTGGPPPSRPGVCSACQRDLDPAHAYCPHCGQRVPPEV